jgi:hypothetical protein
MSRPKGSKNKIHSGIFYPRKCNHCDYVSNNPAMWHYHDKTHSLIPAGQLCDHGCGEPAKFINTNQTYSCSKISHQCPQYKKLHSTRVREQWSRPESEARKEKTKKSLIDRLHNPETISKQIKTKRENFGTLDPEKAKDFRHYARFVRSRAQKWAVSQGYVLGKQTYHVDHKFSVLDAWKNNLPEHIVNHPANLQIVEAKQNISKGSKSSITLEELIQLSNTFVLQEL